MSQQMHLTQLGWSGFFQQQLSLEQWQQGTLARVSAVHRSIIEVITADFKPLSLPILSNMTDLTVGDWILCDDQGHLLDVLQRFSLFSRKAAGNKAQLQLIAANIDTVFIVCALNNNFNLSRIERYLALAKEAAVEPVVVLSKADLCQDIEHALAQVAALDPMLMVVALNCLDEQSKSVLQPWCKPGKTVAVLGSSGVGKSSLINTLLGHEQLLTGNAREQDSRGRHTTTGRTLHLMADGGLLLDTPGMRELQLSDCEQGVEATFADVTSLVEQCRFSDCHHQTEPGCAVQAALADGTLSARRFNNYQKLLKEQAHNSATLAQRRQREKQLHRGYRSIINAAQQRKKGG